MFLLTMLFITVATARVQASNRDVDVRAQGATLASTTKSQGATTSVQLAPTVGIRDTLKVKILRDEPTGWSASDWITLTSTIIALVAVIVGPLSAYHLAQKQIAATVVSSNRQAWINELRGHLAELDAAFFEIAATHKPGAAIEEKISAWRTAVFVRAKIRLLLNPAESDHQELLRLAGLAYDETAEPVDANKLNAARDVMMVKAGQVLKREWERVKSGK